MSVRIGPCCSTLYLKAIICCSFQDIVATMTGNVKVYGNTAMFFPPFFQRETTYMTSMNKPFQSGVYSYKKEFASKGANLSLKGGLLLKSRPPWGKEAKRKTIELLPLEVYPFTLITVQFYNFTCCIFYLVMLP